MVRIMALHAVPLTRQPLSMHNTHTHTHIHRKSALAGSSTPKGEGGAMALTAVANRSSAIGMLSGIADRAAVISQAGAYLHW